MAALSGQEAGGGGWDPVSLWQGFWGESSSDWHGSVWVRLPDTSVWLNHQWDSDVQRQDGTGEAQRGEEADDY